MAKSKIQLLNGNLVSEQSDNSLPSIFDDGDAYDLVLKDIPYGLDFYVTLAREANGPARTLVTSPFAVFTTSV